MNIALICCFLVMIFCIALAVWLGKLLIKAQTNLSEAQATKKLQEELNLSKEKELSSQRDLLRSEFANLAAELLGNKQKELSKANVDSVSTLFTSLKEKLDKYEEEVEKSAKSNRDMGAELKTHVESLNKFATEARAFTSALIGGNKIQGNKGEDILASILEQSGMKRGLHFDMQQGARDEGRPDVTIYDIRNKHTILIDSKMNIKDYIAAYNLPDDAAHKDEKARALKAHVASIKRQVDSLSSKNYAEKITPKEGYSNLPLVAMFCPFDTILEAALIAEPSLVQYAYEKNIVFVTPLTLWGYLWLISWGWKQHEVERKYDEIQNLGSSVISAVDALLNDLKDMGDALSKAQTAFDNLEKRATIDKGQMSIRRAATNLLNYGVSAKGKLKQLGKTGEE